MELRRTFTKKQVDKIYNQAKIERNPKKFDLPSYQVVLTIKGLCSKMWKEDFPTWLQKLSLDHTNFPFYIWDVLLETFSEDHRIVTNRPKSPKQKILEAIVQVLDNHKLS